MQKKEVCVWWGGKEVLSDTWHSFPKWGDGKLRKKKDIAKPQNLIRSGGDA